MKIRYLSQQKLQLHCTLQAWLVCMILLSIMSMRRVVEWPIFQLWRRAIGGQENFEAQSPFQLLHKESNENTNSVDTTRRLEWAEKGIAAQADRNGILSGSLDTASSHQNEPETKIVQKSKRAISQVWKSTQLWLEFTQIMPRVSTVVLYYQLEGLTHSSCAISSFSSPEFGALSSASLMLQQGDWCESQVVVKFSSDWKWLQRGQCALRISFCFMTKVVLCCLYSAALAPVVAYFVLLWNLFQLGPLTFDKAQAWFWGFEDSRKVTISIIHGMKCIC